MEHAKTIAALTAARTAIDEALAALGDKRRPVGRSHRQESDLLHGLGAIAAYLGMETRQVRHLAENSDMPTFRLGRFVCARHGDLDRWLARRAS